MSLTFPPNAPRLIVPVVIVGPNRSYEFRFTLDTGSELTVLPGRYLRRLGCDLTQPAGWTNLRTITGFARVPLIRVAAVTALGRIRRDMLVAAHDFPLGVESDGLLGLDFFRGLILRIDFHRGRIDLDPPRRWWQLWRAA
jgi:hypothetical protein